MSIFQKLKKKKARLVTITAVDENTLVYHFIVKGKVQNVKVNLKNNETESLTKIFPNAELYEREIFDMFGIKFKGHPKLESLFLSEEVKQPLKKSN
jgi:NADH:ubiquinone oxidoreductase subunit C